MICLWTRWLISRSHDLGKPLPGFAARHAGRCGRCREYARFCGTLPSRLTESLPVRLDRTPAFPPFRPAASSKDAGNRPHGEFRRPVFLRPLPMAAAVLVLAAGVFLFQRITSGPPMSAERAQMALENLRKVTAVPDEWPSVVTTAESSLDGERVLVENAARSAFEFLQNRLNIKIERSGRQAT